MTIFDDGLKLLRDRGMEFVDKFIPPLLSSYACHVTNLANRKRKFFYMGDTIPDLRMHVLIVSPPGWGRCVSGDTRVVLSDGSEVNIEDLESSNINALTLKDGKLAESKIEGWTKRQSDNYYRVTTRHNRVVKCSGDHPIMTWRGWIPASKLNNDDWIASPKHIPFGKTKENPDKAYLLGALIADGSISQDRSPICICDPNDERITKITECAKVFGLETRRNTDIISHRIVFPKNFKRAKYQRNPLKQWLIDLGIHGKKSPERFVPNIVFTWDKPALAAFLCGLFSHDGNLSPGSIQYVTTSERLARDVQSLLLRFGIDASLYNRDPPKPHKHGKTMIIGRHRPWRISISSKRNIEKFWDEIGFVGKTKNDIRPDGPTIVHNFPPGIWSLIKKVKGKTPWSKIERDVGHRINYSRGSSASRKTIEEIASLLDNSDLSSIVFSDVRWEKVKSVKHTQEDITLYDIGIPDGRCFIGNGLVLHNSYALKHLMHQDYGILNTPAIKMRFAGFSTEAGLIGSNERHSGQVIKIKGLFEEYSEGIIGIEEFFAISQAMEQQHSSHMEPALNQALLDGDVRKRLRSGPIEYHTDVTLHAGTQTTRFKVGGGLLRRFFLINWVPSTREKKLMKRAYHKSTNLKLDPQRLKDYRDEIVQFNRDVSIIKSISFSDEIKDSMVDLTHFNEAVMRKFALGYNLLSQDLEKDFVVDLDWRLGQYIESANGWRQTLIGDPEIDLIQRVVEENGGKIKWKTLKLRLIDFSMRFDATDIIIQRMLRNKDLFYERGMLYLPEIYFKMKGGKLRDYYG